MSHRQHPDIKIKPSEMEINRRIKGMGVNLFWKTEKSAEIKKISYNYRCCIL